MTFPILLFQSDFSIPIWVAVIGFFGVIVAPVLSAYVVYYFTRPKTDAEVKEKQLQNQKTQIQNAQFENQAFNDTQVIIKTYQKTITNQNVRIHDLECQVKIKELEIAEEHGAKAEILKQREIATKEVTRLQHEVAEVIEHNKLADEKILKLEKDNEALNTRLNVIIGLMQKEGFAVPESFQWVVQPLPIDTNGIEEIGK